MDTANDNPLKRFTTVLWGLGLIALFGVLALLVSPWLRKDTKDPVYKEQEAKRHEIRAEMEEAQKTVLKVEPEAVFGAVGKELLAAKPAPVKDPSQIVPGSERAKKLAEGGSDELPEIAENPADMAVDPAVLELGKAQYALCSACHGPTGDGVPNLAPPLAGSEWVNGPCLLYTSPSPRDS